MGSFFSDPIQIIGWEINLLFLPFCVRDFRQLGRSWLELLAKIKQVIRYEMLDHIRPVRREPRQYHLYNRELYQYHSNE